jgi:DNA-directed RNA polymerase specialized sigma24 family protein
MTPAPEGSITHWIGELRAGARIDTAAQRLWERYYDQLVHLARSRLRAAPRGPADEEDAALSAFDSFCRGVAAGRFPQLGCRGDLWRILVTLTVRKAADQVQHERRQKRGGGRVLGAAALDGAEADAGGGLEAIAGREPSPAFAALVADEVRRRLAALRDESLRRVALLRLEGYTNEEIAARLDCGRRSVERKLELIRHAWLREEGP